MQWNRTSAMWNRSREGLRETPESSGPTGADRRALPAVVEWVAGATVLLLFLSAGTLVTEVFAIALPAPIIGMILLVVALRSPAGAWLAGILSRASDSLLTLMPLLLIPLAAGVMDEAGILAADGPAVVAALVAAWLAATVVTAGIASAAFRWRSRR